MSKMQKAIEVPDFIDIVDFLGPKDRFLDTVKRYYDVQMKFDNKELRVFGEEEEVLKATSVLSRILEMLESGEPVLEKDVDLFSRQEREDKLDDVPNDIIFKIGKTTVKAKTKHQIEYANAIQDNTITFAIGPAGTAKTYLAATLAAKSLKEKKVKKIIITRSPIALEGYSLGFIPGTNEEKMAPWVSPLVDVFSKFYSPEKLQELFDKGIIEAVPLAYIRGRSFDESYVILDEAQNISISAFKSVMTRIGEDSKLVICGDTKQSDIGNTSGLETAARIMSGADGVSIIRFGIEDIVRSGITAEVIKRFAEAGY